MDENFLNQNKQLEDPQAFAQQDEHLSKLKELKYTYESDLFKYLPINQPGIYTLCGGILTGKTTLIKQWIAKLLAQGVPLHAIAFYSGVQIDSYHELINLLQQQLLNKPPDIIQYVAIDDVMRINGWEKGIKFVADLGLLENTVLLFSSSEANLKEKLQKTFPQRVPIDFHLFPLSFHEFVAMKHPNVDAMNINLYDEFNKYLLHGGYLIAINDMAKHGEIQDSTLQLYSNCLRKIFLRHDKQENFLLEISSVIIKNYNSAVTWNSLTRELSINHPKTIGDYITLLEQLDAVFVQSALLEKTLTKAPKKARKLMFFDPFIFHAMKAWVNPVKKAFETQMTPMFEDPEMTAKMVGACVTTNYQRFYPTYYFKADGEIDLAYISDGRFWPLLISWTNQLHAKDLKQILKYPNGKILTKAQRSGMIEHVRTEPLPQALWKLKK